MPVREVSIIHNQGETKLLRSVKLLGVAAAVSGAAILSTGPAHAYPYWQGVNLTPYWHCGTTTYHNASYNVLMQTCIVLTPDNQYAQSVLVVRNNASVAINISGYTEDGFGGGVSPCNTSSLNPGLVTGCYGPTVNVAGQSPLKAIGHLVMNNIGDDTFGNVLL
ncbi:hypothetical protein [Streptomyces bobili]|uniref:hypothetical protein n=1 Tax=Streptomyces bobili TaxID=67280 RepID=UPI00371DE423